MPYRTDLLIPIQFYLVSIVLLVSPAGYAADTLPPPKHHLSDD